MPSRETNLNSTENNHLRKADSSLGNKYEQPMTYRKYHSFKLLNSDHNCNFLLLFYLFFKIEKLKYMIYCQHKK